MVRLLIEIFDCVFLGSMVVILAIMALNERGGKQ
jgi:hypothetical protein